MLADSESVDKEAVLIILQRPIVFVQPQSFDKAVMVWLNYRNAYEYWHEQRLALTSEIKQATQNVLEQAQSFTHLNTAASHLTGAAQTLFLQLTVNDIGLCVPLIPSFNPVSETTSPFYTALLWNVLWFRR